MSSRDSYSIGRFRSALKAFAIGRALQAGATLALLLLTVRLLDRTDYGAYMILWAMIELADLLSGVGLQPVVQQYLPRLASGGKLIQVMRFAGWMVLLRCATTTLLAAGIMLTWGPLTSWFGLERASTVNVPLFAAVLGSVVLARFLSEMLEAMLEQGDSQSLRAMQPIVRLLGLLTLTGIGAVSLGALLLVDLAAALAGVVLGSCRLWVRAGALRPGPGTSISIRDVVGFGSHLAAAQLLSAIGSQASVRLLVGSVLGVEAAGAYAFLQQLVFVGQRYLPSILLANMIRPMMITRYGRGQGNEVATGFGMLLKLNLCLVLTLVVATATGGDAILASASAGVAAGSGAAMTLLVVALLANAQTSVINMAMEVYGYPSKVLLSSMMAPLALVLAGLGGQGLGLLGVAAGVAAAAWLRSGTGLWLLQRQRPRMTVDLSGMYRVTLACLAVSAVGAAVAAWVGGFASAAASLLAFSALLLWLRPFSEQEGALIEISFGRRFTFFQRLVRHP